MEIVPNDDKTLAPSDSLRPVWQSETAFGWRSESELEEQHRVLIVDDDPNLIRLLRTILRTGGYTVEAVQDSYEALELAGRDHFDVIVMDLRMPRLDGRALFRELRARGVTVPVLIASAYGARAAQIELGAEGSIEKPFDPDLFLDLVKELVLKDPGSPNLRRQRRVPGPTPRRL